MRNRLLRKWLLSLKLLIIFLGTCVEISNAQSCVGVGSNVYDEFTQSQYSICDLRLCTPCNFWTPTHGTPSTRFSGAPGGLGLSNSISSSQAGIYRPVEFISGKCYTLSISVLSNGVNDLVIKMANDLVPAPCNGVLNQVTTSSTQSVFEGKINTQNSFETIIVNFTPTQNFCNIWIYGYATIDLVQIQENVSPSTCDFVSHLSCSGNNITYDNNAIVPNSYAVNDYIVLGDVDQSGVGVTVNLTGTDNVDLRAGNYIDFVEGTDIEVSSTGYFNAQIQQCIEAANGSRTSSFLQKKQEILQNLQVNLSPNPTQGRVNVEVKAGETSSIRVTVINLKGEVVKVLEDTGAQSQTFPVDLSNQPKGIYLVKVTTDKGSVVKRVVVN